jgi:hypothetical protein
MPCQVASVVRGSVLRSRVLSLAETAPEDLVVQTETPFKACPTTYIAGGRDRSRYVVAEYNPKQVKRGGVLPYAPCHLAELCA